MGILGDRITEAVEGWIEAWRERLRGWTISVIDLGMEALLKAIGKSTARLLTPIIEEMEATNVIPEGLKPLFAEMKAPKGEAGGAIGMLVGGSVTGGATSSMLAPWFALMNQAMSMKFPWQLFDPTVAFHLYFRGIMTKDDLYDMMRRAGWKDEWTDAYEHAFLFYPSPGDLVHWQAREVFEPEMIERYGLDDEFEGLRHEDFRKVGVNEEQERNFWRAHWEHPELRTIVEMLRRTDFSEEDMKDWFRLVEIPPFWRDKLIAISWNVPTRVDVRRFWDMRTIDEARLREIYTWQGYHGKDLEDYVLWTKVYCAFPDLIARWKNGWITIDDVRRELTGLGMPAARVDEMIETKIKPDQAERTTKEKDLTKSEITKGVKVERITRDEGVELLMELGYDEDEAIYILAINVPVDEQVSQVKKRELTKADIYNLLRIEEIDDAEALKRLEELRYTPDDAELLLKIFRSRIKPPAEPRDKEASKADIVLAVKKGVITPEDAYLMLQDIDYSPEAAQFILTVRAESSPFSPVNLGEFKDLTQKWRRAIGMKGKAVPEELKKAADAVVRTTKEVESLKAAIAEEEKGLIEAEVLPPEATKKRDELRVSLHRAEAELARVQGEYDRLKAEFKHGE